MDLFQALILAIVQGLTEFLPVSSSGHLILVPVLLGWEDQGLAFDVAVHVGTLAAVMFYFRSEILVMLRDWLLSLRARRTVGDSRLAWAVFIGTLPIGFAGLLLEEFAETVLRSPRIIAVTTIGFGLLLWLADVRGVRTRDVHHMSWRDILLIGFAQTLALIPGTSRSGITITAALFLGLTRGAAARFSFLLSVPVILLAGGLKTVELMQSEVVVDWTAIFLGVVVAAVSAWLCVHYMLKLLDRFGMLPFVLYRLLLGVYLALVFF